MEFAGTKARKCLLWGALCLGSCKPTADNSAVSAPQPSSSSVEKEPVAAINDAAPPVEDAALPMQDAAPLVEDAAVPQNDAGADRENSPVAQYARRETIIPAKEGLSVFEYPGESVCPKLPEKRPADFTLILKTRGYEPTKWTYYGISEKRPCYMPWAAPWIEPPATGCKVLGADKFDKVYAELRKLSPETIRMTTLTGHVSPHRGGWAIHMRWGQAEGAESGAKSSTFKERNVECSVSDISRSEVDARDSDRFEAVKQLVIKAYE